MGPEVQTRFLIISDTHSKEWIAKDTLYPDEPVDVAIRCGDLTERSTLAEFKQAVEVLKRINAPLKHVIPGNDDDFTLDTVMFGKIYHKSQTSPNIWSEAYNVASAHYGRVGQAAKLISRGLFRRLYETEGR
ncbi:hypothetical protein NKR19_g3289 [Coniochaeta hoffmannii]|uniref:Calcineurin-like phosphoesterase domain-containing protein n=1 Tax=Coniochaeta hoffmannii TaxID=91930 RepID=A0AA38VM67_9PEZI|nr:hypothetical protein NKR19_g3289 [Coniochaeta hoffmannii]